MPRIPTKNAQYKKKRINKDTNLNIFNNDTFLELLQYWNAAYLSREIYIHNGINTVINLLKTHINSVIENEAYLNSRLSRFDEKVFEYYMEIINCYLTVEDIYNKYKNNIKSNKIRIILNGLMDVINSRIKEFKDLNNTNNNPIKYEKKQLIDIYVNKLNKDINISYKAKLAEINFFKNKFSYEDIINFILSNYLDTIYNSYNKYLNQSIISLDQIEYRRSLNSYLKLLKNEEEVFTSIIKIQASQLEQQENDIEVVQAILYPIRETYQHLCKNIDNLNLLEKQINTNIYTKNLSLNEFQDKIYNLLITDKSTFLGLTDVYKDKYEKSIDIFLNSLNLSLCSFIFSSKINKTRFNFRFTINNSKNYYNNFAESMINIFLNIINYSFSKAEQLKLLEIENKIIEGITDTLHIKIESLKESVNNYNEDLENIYSDYNLPKNIILDVVEAWFDMFSNTHNTIKKTEEFFNIIIKEKYDIFNTWFEKTKNNKLLSLEKKDYLYKKDYLLFEITTFEELINFSVSRLKNSSSPSVILYVQVVEEAYNKLHKLLHNNNIEPIRPHPHEMFNGKEHEVILAQKQEGFKKGEIIKVSNSGYKQNDKVILRANVIAAR